MNLATIHAEVVKTLEASADKVANRRKTIAKLAKALERQNALLVPLLRRRKAWFSTTQSVTLAADGSVRVQLFGIDVGKLSLNRSASEPFYEFEPTFSYREALRLPEGPWRWSHHQKDGKTIREYLRRCKGLGRASAENEREIQWQLADALKSVHNKALRHLKPVTWNGCFTEVGVAVKLDGATATGNIDLVVRRGIGGQRGFLTFELKKPGEHELEIALQQALRYATALDWEANEGGPDNLRNYHAVFGSNGKRAIKVGAVVVLEDDVRGLVRRTAPSILRQYWMTPGSSKIDRIGLLLYKFDPREKKAKSWEWLAGWDASKRLPPPQTTEI